MLAKIYVDGVDTTFLSAKITREGERSVDISTVTFPSNKFPEHNSDIEYVSDVVSLQNLLACYTFEDHFQDESGHRHHGRGSVPIPRSSSHWKFEDLLVDRGRLNNTLVKQAGTETYANAQVGKGLVFDGSTYYFANDADYDWTHQHRLSIGFWIKENNTGVESVIMSKGNGGAGSTRIYFDTSDNIHIEAIGTGGAGSDEIDVSYDTSIRDDTLHLVLFTYDASESASGVKTYIDGELVSTTTNTDNLSSTLINNLELALGAHNDGTNKLTGTLDEFRIFKDRIITADEAMAMYTRGIITYNQETIGKSGIFDGSKTVIKVSDNSELDFTGEFMIWWKGYTSASAIQVLQQKRTGTTDGYALFMNANGTVTFRALTSEVTSTATINDGLTHTIRVARNSGGTITLYIDNSSEGTVVEAGDLSTSAQMFIGADYDLTDYFNGNIIMSKIYSQELGTDDISRLETKTTPVHLMWFGGKVWKIEKPTEVKQVQCKSYGKVIGEIEMRGDVFENQTPAQIMESIIEENTDLIFIEDSSTSSTVTVGKFIADGKLLDVVTDLARFDNKIWKVDANRNFFYQPFNVHSVGIQFKHGVNARIFESGEDDTELVNDLIVLGENKRYQAQESFDGDASKTVFTLVAGQPVSVRAVVDGSEMIPGIDFNYDTENKTVTFVVAPASGTDNVVITYEYEQPLYIRQIRQSSIDQNGRRAKRLIVPAIKTYADGVRFVSSYLNVFKDIKLNVTAEVPGLEHRIIENNVIQLVNTVKGIDDTFLVKTIKWNYPKGITSLITGEFSFDEHEAKKQVLEKIHDLENAITSVKDIQEYEAVEEVLSMIDLVNIGLVEEFSETLSLSDGTPTVTEVFPATYGATGVEYGTDDIYADSASPT